ncbi:MAG: SLC13 family permease [Pseudomonadota bacterium]
MTLDLLVTVAVLFGCVGTLIFTRAAPDIVLMGGLTVLLGGGVIGAADGLSGFANEGTITVAVLYVVAAGLRETGALDVVVRGLFHRARSVASAQLLLMLPVTVASGFVNNTPVVACFIPAVMDWAKKMRISPSRLMMPMSYAAILGGSCTLVGTSTNLIVNGLLLAQPEVRGLAFAELALVGVPSAIIGICYVLLTSRHLLPDRDGSVEELRNPREYTVEMIVEPEGPLVGQTVEQAQLRNLPGLYLIEIDRDGDVLPAVTPKEMLHAGDRLVFAGVTESIIDLQRIRGLQPATDQLFKLDSPRRSREFIEAVVSPTSPTAYKTVKESRFRRRYGAVVIAVARDGQRIARKLGDIRLHAGDTLLLEAEEGFSRRYRNSRDFLLLRPIHDARPPRHERAGVAWLILCAMVLLAATGITSMLQAALLGAGAMVLTRCCTGSIARNSVDTQVVVVIAAAYGIGQAVEASGAAAWLATTMLAVTSGNPVLLLGAIYVMTVLMTSLITNAAAAVLMFPIAVAGAESLGVSPLPYAVAIAMAASASFATPIGYQTNLMVYGPGGYRFSDYLRFGVPLNLLLGATAIVLIPWVWPLYPG